MLEQCFSTAGTRTGTGTWRPSYRDLINKKYWKCNSNEAYTPRYYVAEKNMNKNTYNLGKN